MADTIYDVVVVGGGPAGYTCAIRAAQYGLKVALVEKTDKLGGTCLHVGCIPTKALLFSAEVFDHIKHAQEYGLTVPGETKVNWTDVLKRKNDIITKHTNGLNFLMKKNKITVVNGFGKLTGGAKDGVFTISIDGGKEKQVQAKKVVIATGSDARMLPGYKASDKIMTNIEILSISDVPKTLVVIGSGAVGSEFASIFKSFNSEVTLIEALPRIVPAEDEDVSKELLRLFKKRGIDTHVSAKVDKIEETKTGVKVSFITSDGKPVVKEADKVLVAVGRAPRTEGVGLETTKIKTDRGFITVNEWMETVEPGVYAIGDIVAGFPQLAHSGSMAGLVVAAKIAGKSAQPLRRDRIPGATYCEPQIGSVGLTEAKAKEAGYDVKVGKFPFVGNSKATIVGSHDGFVKVVSDKKYGEILGVHIIGPQATEIISEAVTAMSLEGTVESMMFTVHAHPTLSEALLDGFSSVEGMSVNV